MSGLILGLAAFGAVLVLPPPAGLELAGWRTVGVATMMASFWMSECVPIPVTALLPLVLFPTLEIAGTGAAAASYAHPLIFLFLGGFLIALAMQRWNLHRRIALGLLARVGTRPRSIVLGLMVVSALISMWVSNTATSLMMLPIAVSILAVSSPGSGEGDGFRPAVMLAVAYGCTIGGVGTLIGTPPNALLAAFVAETSGIDLGFGQWMAVGVPVMLVGLALGYWVLVGVAFRIPGGEMPGVRDVVAAERRKLGPVKPAEKWVAVVFLLTAVLWIVRPLLGGALPMLSDTTIAMAGALALFFIPAKGEGGFVMDWGEARKLPWDVLILFGGGLSLATMIDGTGVASWMGGGLEGLSALPPWVFLTILCAGILLLTELTSNTATTATFLPVVAAVALVLGEPPLKLLVPTALAASFSFMMPVGTPPNAVVFGSGMVSLGQMIRAGLWLNLLFVPLNVLVALYLAPLFLPF